MHGLFPGTNTLYRSILSERQILRFGMFGFVWFLITQFLNCYGITLASYLSTVLGVGSDMVALCKCFADWLVKVFQLNIHYHKLQPHPGFPTCWWTGTLHV